MDQRKTQALQPPQPALQYDAPHIDLVLTPEELEREVLYAGFGSPPSN
jgi:hypothetical protein